MNRLLRPILLLCLVIALMGSTLVGCTSAAPTTAAVTGAPSKALETAAPEAANDIMTPYGKYPEPIEYTVGHAAESGLPEGVTLDDNAITKLIFDKLNVKTKIAWAVPWGEYDQKVALCISSGDIPDFMRVNSATFKQMVNAGMLADLTESFDKCLTPFMKEIHASFPPSHMNAVTDNGKIMAIPTAICPIETRILWLRYDWLTKLNLQTPKTMDDVFAIAKEFATKKPGGEGTIGLNCAADEYCMPYSMDPVYSAYGAFPRRWVKDSTGKVMYGSIAPEMKTALTKLNELYKEGVLGKDFGAKTEKMFQTAVADNTAGILFSYWWAPNYPLNNSRKADPTVDWRPYLVPSTADGKTISLLTDSTPTMLVCRKDYEHPEALAKVYNCQYEAWKGVLPEGLAIYNDYTSKGMAWTICPLLAECDYFDSLKRDGTAIKEALDTNSDAKLKPDLKSVFALIKEYQANPAGASQAAWQEEKGRAEALQLVATDNVEFIEGVFYGTTTTMETKWATLRTMEDEIILKIIVGEKSVADFDKFVEDWKKLGGDQITSEVQAAIGN